MQHFSANSLDGVRAVCFALSLLEKGPSIYMHHLKALPIKELSSVPSCIRIRLFNPYRIRNSIVSCISIRIAFIQG